MVERYMRLYENAAGAANKPNQSARCDARPCCRTILMLGPAATQIGGMVTSIDILMRSPLRERFALYRQATPAPRANSQRVIRRILRHAAALAGLARTLTARRVDLLHIHTCSYLTFYRSVLDLGLAKALGCAVVVHIRGGQFENFARSAGRIGQTIIRRALALADALLVVSAHGREIVRPYAGLTPVYAVPNAVEPAAAVSTPHNGHPCRFLYLAKLTRAKGLGDLLRAASELHASDQPFELWIAGPSDDVDQTSWQRAARAAGLEELTTFTGPVRGDAKTQLLRGADCFVHPSHSEALPNAVLEAAAAGLPVIATAVGSLPEALTTAGDSQPLCPLVPPHDVSALVQAMRRLAADSAARQRIGSALRQHVAACNSPARVAEQLAAVYERVLGRARP
jgi:glycosyltransferase involved in cell wall biosynthesis